MKSSQSPQYKQPDLLSIAFNPISDMTATMDGDTYKSNVSWLGHEHLYLYVMRLLHIGGMDRWA